MKKYCSELWKLTYQNIEMSFKNVLDYRTTVIFMFLLIL